MDKKGMLLMKKSLDKMFKSVKKEMARRGHCLKKYKSSSIMLLFDIKGFDDWQFYLMYKKEGLLLFVEHKLLLDKVSAYKVHSTLNVTDDDFIDKFCRVLNSIKENPTKEFARSLYYNDIDDMTQEDFDLAYNKFVEERYNARLKQLKEYHRFISELKKFKQVQNFHSILIFSNCNTSIHTYDIVIVSDDESKDEEVMKKLFCYFVSSKELYDMFDFDQFISTKEFERGLYDKERLIKII